MYRTNSMVSELNQIVGVSEEIKQVVARALQIDHLAINAIVLAKQAGQAARGFGQVSLELSAFSHTLKTCMETLARRTDGLVDAVTSRLKRGRLQAILNLAATEPQAGANLLSAVRRAEEQREHWSRCLEQSRRDLAGELEQANQLAELGKVLARSARIEAAYGGAFGAPLALLSNDFANVIDRIAGSLAVLRTLTSNPAS